MPHFHPKANETIIVNSGTFVANLDFEKEKFDIKETTALNFPAGHIHSLKTLTDVSYLVLRDCDDKLIYLSTLVRDRASKSPFGFVYPEKLYLDSAMSITSFFIHPGDGSNEIVNDADFSIYKIRKGTGQIVSDTGIIEKLSGGESKKIVKDVSHAIMNVGRIPLEVLLFEYKK
jgi:mannose-6-phosphate isomerase-like protein (cupin superfamily)